MRLASAAIDAGVKTYFNPSSWDSSIGELFILEDVKELNSFIAQLEDRKSNLSLLVKKKIEADEDWILGTEGKNALNNIRHAGYFIEKAKASIAIELVEEVEPLINNDKVVALVLPMIFSSGSWN